MESALCVDLAQQHGGGALIRPAAQRLLGFGRGEIGQSFPQVLAGQRQRIVFAGRRLGRARRQLGEDLVEHPGVEIESRSRRVRFDVRRDFGNQGQHGVGQVQVDRQAELLRHVVRIELLRACDAPQGRIVFTEGGQREAEVVMRSRRVGIVLDRSGEGIARIFRATQL